MYSKWGGDPPNGVPPHAKYLCSLISLKLVEFGMIFSLFGCLWKLVDFGMIFFHFVGLVGTPNGGATPQMGYPPHAKYLVFRISWKLVESGMVGTPNGGATPPNGVPPPCKVPVFVDFIEIG